MNRATAKVITLSTTAVTLTFGVIGLASPAGAASVRTRPAATTAQCKGAIVKPKVHADAVRREGTLADLVAKLGERQDPYGLNGAQISTLQTASAGITALDAQIANTCYPTLAALHADAMKLFVDYRVYWLRVPQTHVIEAGDRLAEARSRLGAASAKLAGLVGSNTAAQTDLAAMNTELAAADGQLGTPPTVGPAIAPVVSLQPAADMSGDTAALEAAHGGLLMARSSLVEARADGLKVVQDLRS
jgi:hypothetical protein